MDAQAELIERCARHRDERLGGLSPEAYAELVAAVRENPASFVDSASDEAFAVVARVLEGVRSASRDDEFLTDDEYERVRSERLAKLNAAAREALAIDPDCVDAQLIAALAADEAPSPTLERLLELERAADAVQLVPPSSGDAWDSVFGRPRLRVKAAAARLCLSTTHAGMARDRCLELLDVAPTDVLGARFTLALAYARLEDEPGLDALDARFARRGNAWMHLARVLLMFKLDRIPAARRALRGYVGLCEGGAYALARPTYVERYIPDRPPFTPGSFEEAVLANHEADPVVVDTPDFVGWALDQPGFADACGAWANSNGLEW